MEASPLMIQQELWKILSVLAIPVSGVQGLAGPLVGAALIDGR